MPAAEGLALGFVNEVVEGDVLAAARAWAERLLECSPLSLRATKQAVHAGLGVSLAEGFAAQWDLPDLQTMLASADAIEGPKAFVEKRVPLWSGR